MPGIRTVSRPEHYGHLKPSNSLLSWALQNLQHHPWPLLSTSCTHIPPSRSSKKKKMSKMSNVSEGQNHPWLTTTGINGWKINLTGWSNRRPSSLLGREMENKILRLHAEGKHHLTTCLSDSARCKINATKSLGHTYIFHYIWNQDLPYIMKTTICGWVGLREQIISFHVTKAR